MISWILRFFFGDLVGRLETTAKEVESLSKRLELRDEMLASLHGEVLHLRSEVDRLSRAVVELLVRRSRMPNRSVDLAIEELLLGEEPSSGY